MTKDAVRSRPDRFKARRALVEQLQHEGSSRRSPSTATRWACERCGTVVEPLVSTQWFVKIGARGRASRRGRRARGLPAGQLDEDLFRVDDEHPRLVHLAAAVVGHRIPAWYCDSCGQTLVLEEDPAGCTCGGACARTPTCSTRGSRRASGPSAPWLARADARPRALLPDDAAADRVRHHLLWSRG